MIKKFLFEVPVIISTLNGKPVLVIKKTVSDSTIIRNILQSLIDEQPIEVKPYFKKPHLQINNCLQKGILHKDKQNNYRFTQY